jgi:glycosyltransferase involved in cell wall biosynthesis
MIQPWPSISIVTPSLNCGSMIGRAIESVLAQDYPGVQHIVCDGGSTDGTREVLDRHRHLSVSMGPDESSHHAINQGLDRAEAELVGFLNADDWYEPEVFAAIAEAFRADPALDMICGATAFHGGHDGETLLFRRRHRDGEHRLDELTLGVPAFNSYFFRRRLLLRLGGFRTQFQYAADRDLLLRAFANATCRTLDRPIYNYRLHPGSRTMGGNIEARRAIRHEHLGIAADILESHPTPANLRRALIRWQAFETCLLAQSEFSQGHPWSASIYLVSSLAQPHRLVPAFANKLRMRAEDQQTYITVP